ncbi:hypothetical protein LOTGIDRAFT_232997 [Lottia gigantea]|uniref:Very long-chain fatty acid transport protein n=1 Tax=Lottia gigantea TaxID=225164 RepID=V4A726_LOTGI|nr:hypothetical protein LOTGIDRAFT_232997 [Lottia gigantea]ESO92527.1 hypothetical protein LOTGIDRAFT_232997 [Lottia gigantea]
MGCPMKHQHHHHAQVEKPSVTEIPVQTDLKIVWIISIVVGLLTLVLALLHYKYPWLKYDLLHLKQMFRAIRRYTQKVRRNEFIIDTFELTVTKHPEKIFIIYNDIHYSYYEVNQKANQVARAALQIGVKKGDTVGIMLYNEPAFIWLFFGLQKIGVTVAYINVFLRSKSLAHCVEVSQSNFLIIGDDADLDSAIEDIGESLSDTEVFSISEYESDQRKSFKRIMDEQSTDDFPKECRADVTKNDICQLIFTSGTTGLPKAAIISQDKALKGSVVCSTFNLGPNDVFYETLPLYHSAAGELALFNVIDTGSTMVLRRKFSARCFLADCRKYNVTVIHYIGELCRYLMAAPVTPEDRDHRIRVAFGNGLRSDVWRDFQERFNIPHVAEFYGATEAPVGLINICNQLGSIGRTSPLLKKIFKIEFLRYDHETREPVRNKINNSCIIAKPGEVGLLVVKIHKSVKFEGYRGNKSDNQKKLLKNVFDEGDLYFDSGDLFRIDDNYFLYFRDRMGDTFRWKGENVSTSEVTEVLNTLDFIQDSNVYGVEIPGCEGKAGMAALTLKEGQVLTQDQIKTLHRQCSNELASYARPKFIRVQKQMSLTSTFKQRKIELIDEGFDPKKTEEPLYYYNPIHEQYDGLTDEVFSDIVSGVYRL